MRSVRTGLLLTGVAAAVVAFAPAVPLPAASAAAPDAGAVRYVAALAPGQRPATRPAVAAFRVLQLNLCNSGFAGCYGNGQAVPEAAAVIRAQRPDVVTLNEVCRGDGQRGLFQAMERTWPGDWVFLAFQPAWDSGRNSPFRCKNAEQYGIAVIGHVAPANWVGVDARGGIYPAQEADANEQRAWLCVAAIGNYYACTTHLAANAARTAMAQCRYLMDTAIPHARAAMGGYAPTVVGADLNLTFGGSPDVQDCVPAGWSRMGDNDVQHVLATNDIAFQSTRKTGLTHTDHPAWLAALRTP